MSKESSRTARVVGPRLSVVIPVYNGGAVVANAIQSAWASGAFEVIVVDDGSKDDSVAVAKFLGCTVISQANAGAATARRVGVRQVTGDVVALLDADDRLIPEGVRASIALSQSAEHWAVAGGITIGIMDDGSESPYRRWDRRVDTVSLLEVGYGPCPPSAFIWNKSALNDAMFDDTPAVWPRYAEDYELLIRASMKGPILFHDEPTLYYALEGGKSTLDPTRSIRASELIRKNYAGLLGLRIGSLSERGINSRALLRTAKSLDRPATQARRRRVIAKCVACDPVFMTSFILRSIRFRLRRRLATTA